MRDSLTALALILIFILTAALVGPYFIDWSKEREAVAAQLSEAVGAPVHIAGSINLALLPTPYLALDKVEIGDANGLLHLTAERLRLEIAVAPLLRGEIDFLEARFDKPQVDLTVDADKSFLHARPAADARNNMRFERIAIRDGTLTVRDPTRGHSFAFQEIALEAEARSLFGPFRGEGALKLAGETNRFRLTMGAADEGRSPVKLSIERNSQPSRIEVEGALSFIAKGEQPPSFAGSLRLNGSGSSALGLALPWRLSSALEADMGAARFKNLEVQSGDEAASWTAAGEAEIDYSAAPKARLKLHSKRIDLDHWLSRNSAPPAEAVAQRLAGLLGQTTFTDAAPLPITLNYAADVAALGGDSFKDLAASYAFGGPEAPRLRFDIQGPGQLRLSLDGSLQTGERPNFAGKISATIANAPKLWDWLAANAPHWLDRSRSPPFRRIDLAGDATLSASGARMSGVDLRLDGSAFTGAIDYAPPDGTRRQSLAADLTTHSLDLAALADLGPARDLFASMDLSLRLDADALAFDRPGIAQDDLGRLDVKLAKTDDRVDIDEFTWEGAHGEVIAVSGALTHESAHFDAKIEARRLGPLAALIAAFDPNSAAALIASRLDASSPIDLSLTAEGHTRNGQAELTALRLNGQVGATQVAATLGPDPKQPDAITVEARLDAEDSFVLLRLFDLGTAPVERLAPGHVELVAHGSPGASLDARVKAEIAGTQVDFQGPIKSEPAPAAAGRLKLSGADLSPLLRASGLATPDFATKISAELSGVLAMSPDGMEFREFKGHIADVGVGGTLAYSSKQRGEKALTGALDVDSLSMAGLLSLALGPPEPARAGALWSHLIFRAPFFNPPSSRIGLTIKRFDLLPGVSASPAKMTLEIAPGFLVLRDVALKLGEANAKGSIALQREAANAALEAHVEFDDYAFELAGGKGQLTANFDVASAGKSAEALVAGLAGSGHAIVADYALENCDPAALARIFAASEENRLALGSREVALALEDEFRHAPFRAKSLDFDLGVASGVFHLTPKSPHDPDAPRIKPNNAAAAVSAALDLRNAAVDERLVFTLSAPATDWSGPPPQAVVMIKGPVSSPVRTIDAAAFANALVDRAIKRESARIDAYKSQSQERAVLDEGSRSDPRRDDESSVKSDAGRTTN